MIAVAVSFWLCVPFLFPHENWISELSTSAAAVAASSSSCSGTKLKEEENEKKTFAGAGVLILFLKRNQIRPLFVYFRSFHMTNVAQIDFNDKSIDGELGSWTYGGRMEGADESFELWRHPGVLILYCSFLNGSFRPPFLYFSLFNIVDNIKSNFLLKLGRWLDSNCGPLESEAATEPQPLTVYCSFYYFIFLLFPINKLQNGAIWS